jgi:hypothetical protein
VTHNFDDLKAELLREPAVRAEYDARAEEFEERVALVTAGPQPRCNKFARDRRMGISQSAVARIESGRHWPSRATLQRYAKATGARPVVRLVPLEAR